VTGTTTVSSLSAEDLLAGGTATFRVPIPAHLSPDGDGGGEVVLRPLVLGDIVRLHRAAREDGELAGALMIQQSLVEPKLGIDQVHRLPAGLAEFLLGQVNRVSGLRLSADEIEEMVHQPLARACLVLAREFGWSSERCAELTVGQLLLYLEMAARGDRP
jgi:hypothetical protein